jgi:hypothetical protein
MVSGPSTQQSPSAGPPPHSAGKTLLIVGLILVMLLVGSVFAIYTGVRMLSHSISVHEVRNASGNPQLSIKTPVGNVEIHEGASANVGLLGLPVYPGSRRITHDGNASVTANLGGQKLVGILAARFHTDDPVFKVREFYQKQLGETITHYVAKDSEGKTLFEINRRGQEKIVALRPQDNGTRIELIKIVHGNQETN